MSDSGSCISDSVLNVLWEMLGNYITYVHIVVLYIRFGIKERTKEMQKKKIALVSCFKSVTPFSFRKRCRINRWVVKTLSGECTSKEIFCIVARES